jgi:hypothetical protein
VTHFLAAGESLTAGFRGHRNAKRVATIAAALAFWLAGTTSSARAGCGDYLVGVQDSSGPMGPDHSGDHYPTCRPRDLPIAPPVPVVSIERVPADPAVQEDRDLPSLERGCWWEMEPPLLEHSYSQSIERPPKA